MYELKLIKAVEKMPVFSLADISKITNSRSYAKKLIARLVRQETVKKIMRDAYTVHDDQFLIGPFIYMPSYISCASALQYYGLITQIPNAVFLMTKKRHKTITNNFNLIYHNTKNYFGFKIIDYKGIKLPIAEPEKAFIDSIGIHPIHLILESLEELNPEKLIFYAKKTKEMKRIGYLLEKNNSSVKTQKNISHKYIYLDPLGPKKGRKDKKWKLIVNS